MEEHASANENGQDGFADWRTRAGRGRDHLLDRLDVGEGRIACSCSGMPTSIRAALTYPYVENIVGQATRPEPARKLNDCPGEKSIASR